MPRGGKCNHRNCQGEEDGCKQLTDEELTPSAEDLSYAKGLFDQGYIAISTKYRLVALPLDDPKPEDYIKPEKLNTKLGRTLANFVDRERVWLTREDKAKDSKTLTLRQFRAFKKFEREAEIKEEEDVLR